MADPLVAHHIRIGACEHGTVRIALYDEHDNQIAVAPMTAETAVEACDWMMEAAEKAIAMLSPASGTC